MRFRRKSTTIKICSMLDYRRQIDKIHLCLWISYFLSFGQCICMCIQRREAVWPYTEWLPFDIDVYVFDRLVFAKILCPKKLNSVA